jgi:hypothetical protein
MQELNLLSPHNGIKVSRTLVARRRSLPKMPEITLQLPSLKPSDKLGIFITNDFRIRKTNPGSIGEQAGFLAGDLLVSIDELRSTKGLAPCAETRPRCKHPRASW